jgi:hypothetical protein
MVDAQELMVDSVTISYAPFTGRVPQTIARYGLGIRCVFVTDGIGYLRHGQVSALVKAPPTTSTIKGLTVMSGVAFSGSMF